MPFKLTYEGKIKVKIHNLFYNARKRQKPIEKITTKTTLYSTSFHKDAH